MLGSSARAECAIIGALYRSTREMTAAEISQAAGFRWSWSFWPALYRLEHVTGEVMSHWELAPRAMGRPRRRFYGLGRKANPTPMLPDSKCQAERRG